MFANAFGFNSTLPLTRPTKLGFKNYDEDSSAEGKTAESELSLLLVCRRRHRCICEKIPGNLKNAVLPTFEQGKQLYCEATRGVYVRPSGDQETEPLVLIFQRRVG